MTNLVRLRNLIGDLHKSDVVRFIGDGASTQWQLPRKRIKTDSVVVTGAGGSPAIEVSDVNYATGLVTLSDEVADNTKFSLSFEFSAFTDEELEDYLGSGSVKSAALECIQILMADAARRYDYSTGIEEFKPSQMFEHLEKLKKSLRESDLDLSSSGGAKLKTRTSQYGDLDNLHEDCPPPRVNPYMG